MTQRQCPKCAGPVRQTKQLVFPEGQDKVIYECVNCQRAQVEDANGPDTVLAPK